MANNSTSLYTFTPSSTISSNNFTTLYNTTTGNVEVANVPDKNFTTLYTVQDVLKPTLPYGNSNVEAFLNAGSDIGGNQVQNILMHGSLTVGANSYLGNVGNVHIDGGTLNFVLTTDGYGNLSWTQQDFGNATPYIHFDVSVTANNQQFTNSLLSAYVSNVDFNVMKNGVNIEPSLYEKIDSTTFQVNIPLNTGDTIDVLAGGVGITPPGGNIYEVQYNNGVTLSGNTGFLFNPGLQTVIANNVSVDTLLFANNITAFGNTNLGEINQVKIAGGSSGYSIQTDGLGNLSWVNPTSIVTAGSNTQIQFNNDGAFGASSNLTFNSTTSKLTASYISGDGSNISNITGSNVTGPVATATYATTAGAATSATTAGYAVTAGSTAYAENSNIANVANSVAGSNVVGPVPYASYSNIANTVMVSDQPNITSVGTLISLGVTGNITSGNANLGNLVIANYFSGDGGLLSNITATTGSANYANYAGNVTLGAQPNITSTGTLVSLSVTGNISSGNANLGNLTISNFFSGDGSSLSNLNGGNVNGQVSNALVAGTVYTNAQPNITSTGTLTSLNVTGNISSGNANLGTLVTASRFVSTVATGTQPFFVTSTTTVANLSVANATYANSAGTATTAGTVTTNAQPNITSTGTLVNLTVSGNLSVGNNAAVNNITSTGNVTIQRAFELVTPNNTGSTGTINFDVITQSIINVTANATANCTLNIRGNSTVSLNTLMPTDESLTVVYLNKVGSTAYIVNQLQIDSVNITPLWLNGSSPTVGVRTANAVQSYTYTIIKTAASTYTVIASLSEFV